jgi:N-acetylneuraminic acid mutarotase
MSISNHMAVPTGSPLPAEAKVLKTGEIPVDIINTDKISAIGAMQEDGHGGKPEHQNVFLPAPSAKGDTWTELAEMPTARYNHCSAVVNGKIYVIGGIGKNNKNLFRVEEYDPAAKTWMRKADIPGEGRALASASVVGDKIYVISGFLGGALSPTVQEYDPKTDTWERKSDIPTARCYFSTSVVDGKIYAIGGANVAFGPGLPQVEEYDPASDTWTKKKDMPNPRSLLSTAAVEGKIYAMGGWQVGQPTTALVEEYDPKTDTWTTKASMPMARSVFSVTVVNGKIYAMGGVLNDVLLDAVDMYHPENNKWETKTSMPAGREHHTSCAVDGRIYVMGGTTVFAPKNAFVPVLANFFQYGPEWDSSVSARGKLPTTWGKAKSE